MVISPVISPKVSHRVSLRLMVSQKSTTLRHDVKGLTDLLQIGYKNTGKKGGKAVILRYEDEKSRPITSDFSIFYTKWHQLSPIGHFPMQKREKMVARMSGVVMAPVMEERWWRVSRTSWAMRSAARVVVRPEITRRNESAAAVSAS